MRIGTATEIELILYRHGKTKGNEEGRYVGRTDEGLSQGGRLNLNKVQAEPVDYVFSSPMLRCIESAQILFPGQKAEIIEEFAEMDFGDYEMKNYNELKDEAYYQKWIDSNGSLPFPNGESREVFIERTMKGFEKLCQRLTQMDGIKKVGLVVHGGSIMAIASSILGGDYFDYQIGNGACLKL